MRVFNRICFAIALSLVAGAVNAQPDYAGLASRGQVNLLRSADADAYYLMVRYTGDAVPDVRTRVQGRSLDIRVSQAAGGAGSFFRNRMSRSMRLPPDADPSRMARRKEHGSITIVIPRWRAPAGPWR